MTTAENVQVWFNNKGWASYPAYANTMNNAILRALLPPSLSPDEVGISVFNHPMNYSAEERVLDSGSQNFRSQVYLFQTVLIILAFCIIPASFVLFLIEERVNHSKHQQFVSGVPPWLYWVSSFMWDMANFMMPVVLVMLVFWATGALAYTRTIHEASALFFLLVLYGFAAIPFMYLFSFVFRVAPLAFVVLGGGTFFVGMIATIAVWVLRFIQETGLSTDPDLKTAYDVCKVVFLILPQFNLGSGVMDMTTTYTFYETTVQYLVTLKRQDLINEIPMPSLYSWDHLGKGYVCLLVQGFIFFGLTLLIEYRRTIFKCRCKTNTKAVAKRRASIGGTEDVDVREERQRVEAAADSDDTGLVVRGLTKMYGSKKKLAVDRLTFKVEKGECFGLLGINGAGKTTTFKMLTGKILVDEGDACFHGLSVRRDMHQIYQMVGYCPQFDAQNALLTGREQLAFYARIRGIVEADIEKVVDWAIDNMQLTVYGDETTGSYSGGNKRKLSTALALIGDPAVVLLDEPSAGMDPNARRFMWNLIMDLRRDNHTVVLTSHSMEECETLCTRIGIMVSGRLQCLGSVQHLKHKFGDGYSLTIKLRSADPAVIERACKVIEAELPGARLDDCHCATVRYKLPTRGFRLAAAFKAIQKVRASVDVEDYSLSQTTLDEVFINFAEKQTNADEGGSERLEEEEEAKGEVPFTDHSVSHVAQVVEEPQGEDSVTNEAQASDFVVLRPTAKAPKKKRRRSLVPIADGETKKAADTIVMLNHSPSSSSQSEAGASPPNNVQNV
uniref:ABC transporter domain-containing protein n=1 Tax=Plectus sambesii TaxID=2011161 RepID=A0A914VJY4_9BILA